MNEDDIVPKELPNQVDVVLHKIGERWFNYHREHKLWDNIPNMYEYKDFNNFKETEPVGYDEFLDLVFMIVGAENLAPEK